MNECSRVRAVLVVPTTEVQPPSNTSGGMVGLKMGTEMDHFDINWVLMYHLYLSTTLDRRSPNFKNYIKDVFIAIAGRQTTYTWPFT